VPTNDWAAGVPSIEKWSSHPHDRSAPTGGKLPVDTEAYDAGGEYPFIKKREWNHYWRRQKKSSALFVLDAPKTGPQRTKPPPTGRTENVLRRYLLEQKPITLSFYLLILDTIGAVAGHVNQCTDQKREQDTTKSFTRFLLRRSSPAQEQFRFLSSLIHSLIQVDEAAASSSLSSLPRSH
jgi:hypothetical protein